MSTKITNPYDKNDVLGALKNSYLKEDNNAVKQIHDWVKDVDMIVITKNNYHSVGEIHNLQNHEVDSNNKTILIIHKPYLTEKIFVNKYSLMLHKSLKYLENYDDLKNIINILEINSCEYWSENFRLYKCNMFRIKENVKTWENMGK